MWSWTTPVRGLDQVTETVQCFGSRLTEAANATVVSVQTVDFTAPGEVTVGDHTFVYAVPPPSSNQFGTPPVFKSRVLIEQLDELLREVEPRRIVEFGIFRGGSISLSAAIAQPEKLVAFDLSDNELPVLRAHLEQAGLADVVRPFLGVDQGDQVVVEILNREFGTEPLDLVIDDASHIFGPTRRTLEMVFPLLREGGMYVIEDWAAEHTLLATVLRSIVDRSTEWKAHAEAIAGNLDGIDDELAGLMRGPNPSETDVQRAARRVGAVNVDRPLSRLALELVHLSAETADIVRSVEITQGWIKITRGAGVIDGTAWFERGSIDLFESLRS